MPEKKKLTAKARREKRLASQRAYYYAHRAYFKQKREEWRAKNRDHYLEYCRTYWRQHRVKLLKYQKRYRKTHRAERMAYNKAWRARQRTTIGS